MFYIFVLNYAYNAPMIFTRVTTQEASGRGWRTNNEEAEEHEPKVLLVTRDPVGHTLFLTGIVGQYTYSLSGVVGDAYTAEVSLATFLLF
jgi:hypothetical protein